MPMHKRWATHALNRKDDHATRDATAFGPAARAPGSNWGAGRS